MELLKRSDTQRNPDVFIGDAPADDEVFERIRCPHCAWHPTKASEWSCYVEGTPEPPFDWCGTRWNTFSTGGRCPGGRHQWLWTSCLQCQGWSLHEDWYERG